MLIMAAALAASLAQVSPAQFNNNDELSVVVSTADLDLATEAGRQRLSYRLSAAERKVCPRSHRVTLVESANLSKCKSKARDSAQTGTVAAIDRSRRVRKEQSATHLATQNRDASQKTN